MKHVTGTAITSARLPCNASRAWEKVCFYEHLSLRPSWFLRTVLPVPLRTTGCYRQAGDSSRCLYSDGGFLAKKITRIAPGHSIEFDITEHSIRYCRRILLKGGAIEVTAHADGTSSVRMITRYELRLPAAAIVKFFVGIGIQAMHRIVVRDMQYRLASPAAIGSAVLSCMTAHTSPCSESGERTDGLASRSARSPAWTSTDSRGSTGGITAATATRRIRKDSTTAICSG